MDRREEKGRSSSPPNGVFTNLAEVAAFGVLAVGGFGKGVAEIREQNRSLCEQALAKKGSRFLASP
jgi:hypothetical protein